jgi:uncharacterized protein YegL
MTGKPIHDLRLGIEAFKRDVANDPFAEETVYVGVITFGGEAEFVTKGLIPIGKFRDEFNTESINASGHTNLGQAFNILSKSLDEDFRKSVKGGQKGDWRAIVFVLLGSKPVDGWEEPRSALLSQHRQKILHLVPIGSVVGIEQTLKNIAVGPIVNAGNEAYSLGKVFNWVSQSMFEGELEKALNEQKEVIKMSEQAAGNEQEKTPTQPEISQWKVTQSEGTRRLPVYLLLDTSGSMAGDPIRDVRLGVDAFKEQVANDPFAEETVHVGVITFGEEAEFVTKGLIPIGKFRDEFNTESLSANGGTPLGQALWLLAESLDKDVKASVKGGDKGDWKPLIFILTDGEPTDEWRKPREAILSRQKKKVINLITVGCGPRINQQQLKDISMGSPKGSTFIMGNDSDAFKKFFDWVSQTTSKIAKSISEPDGGEKPTDIDQPPFQYIP